MSVSEKLVTILCVHAQTYSPKEQPQLEFVMQLKVTLDNAYSVVETRLSADDLSYRAVTHTEDGNGTCCLGHAAA